MDYLGSCLCKTVQYKVVGEFESFYLCHCRYCQKDTGSAHAANLFSSTAKLEWVKGENNIRRFQVEHSNHVKAFCLTCGSAVPNVQMEGQLLVVPAGSLDCPLNKMPDGHLFMSNKANWDDALATVKKFARLPVEA